jgi:hypothetical protein
MSTLRIAGVATVLATVTTAVAPMTTASADAPAPGDSCTQVHATTQDANGRTLWCNPTMTGTHSLVWQYGGPSD